MLPQIAATLTTRIQKTDRATVAALFQMMLPVPQATLKTLTLPQIAAALTTRIRKAGQTTVAALFQMMLPAQHHLATLKALRLPQTVAVLTLPQVQAPVKIEKIYS